MKQVISILLFVLIWADLFAQSVSKKFIESGYDESIDKNECSSDAWKKFRKEFYFNFQSVSAFGDEKTGNTVIVSEPPPEVKFEQIETMAKEKFGEAKVFTCTAFVGVDGWRRDVVIQYKGTKKSSDELVSNLHKLIFGSDLTSNVKPHSNEEYKYNYPLKSGQIQRYLKALYPKLSFDKTDPGVYGVKTKEDEKDKALVVWVIDKKKPITDEMKPEFRKFALGTDIIVAGINFSDKLLIVGRRRTIPTTVFPPLRFESFKLLVLIGMKERENEESKKYQNSLSELQNIKPERYRRRHDKIDFSAFSPMMLDQSFNETGLMKINFAEAKNSNWKYSANYLNSYLLKSEIGQNLTVSDVILKSFCEMGDSVTEGFKYPLPKSFPEKGEFLKTLSYKINANGDSYFVYSWKSAGITSIIKYEKYSLLVSNFTAALKVDFSPENSLDSFSSEKKELSKVYSDFFSIGEGRSHFLADTARIVFLKDIFKESRIILSENRDKLDEFRGDDISEIQSIAFEDANKISQKLEKFNSLFQRYIEVFHNFNFQVVQNSKITLSEINALLEPVKEEYGKLIKSLDFLNLDKLISSYEREVKKSSFFKKESSWLNSPTLIRSTIKEYYYTPGGHSNSHLLIKLNKQVIQLNESSDNPVVLERQETNTYVLFLDKGRYGTVQNELLEDINRMQGKEFSDAELRSKEIQFANILNSLLQRTTNAQVIEEAEMILEMNTDSIQGVSAGGSRIDRTHNTFLYNEKKGKVEF